MRNRKSINTFIGLLFFVILIKYVNAQLGPSFSASYDLFPYSNLAKPEKGTLEEDLKIRIANLKLKTSYPQALSQETFLMHEISYDRFDMDYQKWQGGSKIEHGEAIKYNLMIMHTLSEKWSLLAFLTPGLASDFKASLSTDDFTIETAIVFIRKYSESFSVGYGLAYSRQFGEPFPIPILALEWNNGANLKASAILPASFELWYMMHKRVDLGLVLTGDGNEYHGDPRIFGGTEPKMKYSVVNIGPSVKLRLTDWLNMNLDAGYTLFRLFEFTNENPDTKEEYNLDNNAFVRLGFQIGG